MARILMMLVPLLVALVPPAQSEQEMVSVAASAASTIVQHRSAGLGQGTQPSDSMRPSRTRRSSASVAIVNVFTKSQDTTTGNPTGFTFAPDVQQTPTCTFTQNSADKCVVSYAGSSPVYVTTQFDGALPTDGANRTVGPVNFTESVYVFFENPPSASDVQSGTSASTLVPSYVSTSPEYPYIFFNFDTRSSGASTDYYNFYVTSDDFSFCSYLNSISQTNNLAYGNGAVISLNSDAQRHNGHTVYAVKNTQHNLCGELRDDSSKFSVGTLNYYSDSQGNTASTANNWQVFGVCGDRMACSANGQTSAAMGVYPSTILVAVLAFATALLP